jgi:hypothetical protein
MANGVPFVTTSIGFEGFDASEIADACVADSASEFAEKCISLLSNREFNEDIRMKINDFANQNLNPVHFAEKVGSFLSS